MTELYFTHATYRVKPENDTKFREAWKVMVDEFRTLPAPPMWGRLLQSMEDPTLYFAVGAWHDERDIAATRTMPRATAALDRLRALCSQMDRVACRQIEEVMVEQ